MNGVSIYQLKIKLLGTSPLVWRRIEVPSNMSLNNLSYAINLSMGWKCYHLHLFKVDDIEYGSVEHEYEEVWENDKKIKVEKAFKSGKTLMYTYDFGDGWQHEIVFEEEKLVKPTEQYPLCTAGENSCPPEDIGGIGGFAEYKEAIGDIKHERHQEFLDWGGSYDIKNFDVFMANLSLIRKKVAKNLKLKTVL